MPRDGEPVPERWREEWAAAEEIALRAGETLRREARRAGGPRGFGAHAEIDGTVEGEIRAALAERFPRDRFLGEETGSREPSGEPSGRTWVVDPNDGTREFLQGHRGPSVSLALVQDGLPVLGLVYACRAPDEGGDRIAAVEGGPLLRNGRPVRPEWADSTEPAGPGTVILAAPEAERRCRAHVRLLAPARYRTAPGLAYRLALTAVGEGDGTLAVSSPSPWDAAAGQALIRAAGGDLWDEGGRPVRYDEGGRFGSPRAVFGGPRRVAEFLRARNWGSLGMAERDPETEILCRPLRGGSWRTRGGSPGAQGCLLGQLAGDSLGSRVEFRSAEAIRAEYPEGVRDLADGGTWNLLAGQPTDDSEMALALARSLRENGRFDPEAVLRAYRDWLRTDPVDAGTTVRGSLTGHPDRESQANGALMRVAPLGILGAGRSPEEAGRWAREDAALTHPHPVCLQASELFVRAVARAVAEGPSPEELYAGLLREARPGGCAPDLRETLVEAAAPAQPRPEEDLHAGWVRVALRNALWQLLHAPSLEEALADTVGRGGDTDTNAAVCGALLGAVRGREALPLRWVRRILSCRPLAGEPGIARPRPVRYWPVDALPLAEALLGGF